MALRYFNMYFFFSVAILTTCSVCQARWMGSKTAAKTAQNEESNISTHKGAVTNNGRYFVFGFIKPSRFHQGSGTFEIVIQGLENETEVHVQMPHALEKKKYILMKDEVAILEIQNALARVQARVETKGIGIHASKNIVVYAFNKLNTSTGHPSTKQASAKHPSSKQAKSEHRASQEEGFLLFPRRCLGREYVVTTYAGSHSNLGIVGVYNNTTVSIVFNSRVTYRHHLYKRGDTLRLTVNELQTFFVRSRHDLSGARVIADKPVAVFSGTDCVLSGRTSSCGLVMNQLPAVRTWGKTYVVFSGETHTPEDGLVRVTSAFKDTVVILENGITTKLGTGQVMDWVIKSRKPSVISCSPYCMVTVYNTNLFTSGKKHGQTRGHSVPSMVTLPAANQFLPYYRTYIPEQGAVALNIVMRCFASGGLLMNGELQTNLVWKASEDGTWCGATMLIEQEGVNDLSHQDGKITFGIIVMGSRGGISYSYLGGRSFEVGSPRDYNSALNITANKFVGPRDVLKNNGYKIATITLSVLCAIMALFLVCILVHLRTKHSHNDSAKDTTTTTTTNKAAESIYQSIRGFFPRRNTHSYEEVKLPLKRNNRPTVPNIILPPTDNSDYENLKLKGRESNPYVPMDEALAGSAIAGSAIVLGLSGGENDLYLTMKKVLTGDEETEKQDETPE